MMLDKDKILYEFYDVMKTSAVDRELFKNANKFV